MSENKIKIKIEKNELGKIMDCKIEKVKKDEIEKKENSNEEVEMETNEILDEDVEMETNEKKNEEKKGNGWVEPETESSSEGEIQSEESATESETEGSENEEKLLNETNEEGKKNETLKDKMAKKRKEREEKEELQRMMEEMKKMKKEMDEEREKLKKEKNEIERKKNEKQNEMDRMRGGWVTNNRIRVDRNGLPNGWKWVTEGQDWVDGIFGFEDNNGKRIIGMEYNKIKDNRSEKFKGVWNCIMVIRKNGEKLLLDGEMMDERCKNFLESGESARCCQVVSKRGVYKMRRMGRIFGTKGEVIYYFKWMPVADSNIGFGIGAMPHLDCKGGHLIVD